MEKLNLKNGVFLAPMAGVTDKAYRIICSEMGTGLQFTEMVSAKGIYYNDPKTKILMDIDKREGDVALQIFGSDPNIMKKVVKDKLNMRDDIKMIDINMGCPAPKIVKNGDGSALMRNPDLVQALIANVVEVSNKPVSIKIRKGWDDESVNGVDIARIAEKEGVSLITVHGRTREMYYSGKSDWDYIRRVKDALIIPVIGNGDIFTPEDAIKMKEISSCDGVAIGRGVMGNPWLIKNTILALEGNNYTEPSISERMDMAFRHLDLVCEIKGENLGIREMRKHLGWYLKGLKNSNEIRNDINRLENKDEIVRKLRDYFLKLRG